VALTTHPLLAPRLRKSKTILLLPVWVFVAEGELYSDEVICGGEE
jgi:hypothetical protein